MNEVLAEFVCVPEYGFVTVESPGLDEPFEWITGDEPAVFTELAIGVATRFPRDGNVAITVIEGLDPEGLGVLVFDGPLTLTSTTLQVGSPMAGMVFAVDLGRTGTLRVRVFVDSLDNPAVVKVLIDPAAA